MVPCPLGVRVRVERPEINADIVDPNDLNFAYTGKLLAIRSNDGMVRWTRIYLPTKSCLEWDCPPAEVNVATGMRYGWTYATLRVTGKKLVRVPGNVFGHGLKAKITSYNNEFDHGWQAEEPADCWVVVPAYR